jgi:sugar O-acyltransferase (sialic acid O-acetyltransferase NeuD family)
MKKPKIILVGAGGHCCSCIDIIEQTGKFTISGLIEKKNAARESVLNYSILGYDDELEKFREFIDYCLVTIGHIKSSKPRESIYQKLKALNFIFPVIVSKTAYVSKHAVIGEGTIIMHQAIVNAGAKVGNNCIINTHSIVEHDVVIKDHTHISTATVINGNVSIGSGCFIGSNATVVQGVKIPDDYFFRASQLITSPENGFLVKEK